MVDNRILLIELYKEMKKTICEEYNCSMCDRCPVGGFWKDSENQEYNDCQGQELEYNQMFVQSNYSEFIKPRRKLRKI